MNAQIRTISTTTSVTQILRSCSALPIANGWFCENASNRSLRLRTIATAPTAIASRYSTSGTPTVQVIARYWSGGGGACERAVKTMNTNAVATVLTTHIATST